MTALLDNTVLSNFARIGKTHLLEMAFDGAASTTEQAMTEFQNGIATGKLPETDLSWLAVLSLQEKERSVYQKLRSRLDAGEAACLAWAYGRKSIVFTDDRDARETASQMQIPVSGTLGVLLRLIDLRVLTLVQADAILNEMIALGYRSPLSTLASLV